MPGPEQVIAAAQAALADHQYCSFIDVLTGVRLLHSSHVEAWQRGRRQYIDGYLQGSAKTLEMVIQTFQEWARQQGLRAEDMPPHDARSRIPSRQETVSQRPELDKLFRLHFVAAAMPEKKLQKLREKLQTPQPPTVFSIVTEARCSQCQRELERDDFLTMVGKAPWCLECADLDHLVFLGSGDAALTRRSTKHSGLSAVVVRFSRSRGRYERQGVLVESEALEKAEAECEADAEVRAVRQKRDAERRKIEDSKLVEEMTQKIRELYPRCPGKEARGIAVRAAERGSGRVGRSAAGRALEDRAIRLAVRAWVRHKHTKYDELLMRGVERAEARERIQDRLEEVVDQWGEQQAARVS